MNPMMMNPMVAALLGKQMPGQGMPQGGMPNQPGAPPLSLANLDKNRLPPDWLNQISPAERQSIMPQWSNG